MTLIRLDFQADGIPIIPTSATSLSSRSKSFSSAISHNSANPGACLVEETKWAFP